jgi:outer membrane protein OmpA-like peptidoglycan-associated protein
MTRKKYLLALALMLGAASGAWAQLAGTHNYMDSSYIPARRMAQQNEWRNNSKEQNFPARPRDMWQLGITGGMFLIAGDCPPLPGYNFGLSIRKALGYVMSLRGSVVYGQTKGLDYRKNGNLNNNPALSVYATQAGQANTGFYVHNYKTTAIIPSLDALFSLNNIMFHSKQNKLNVTIGFGYSPFIYKTTMNLRNGAAPYAFNTLTPAFFSRKRKDIRSDLRDFFDDSYETAALVDDRSPNFNSSDRSKYQIRHAFSLIGGLEYRLSKKVSLGLDLKYLLTGDDYVDGWIYQGNSAALTSSKDAAILTNLSLNFNLGNPAKRTAPLWQLNPLDWVYSEINNPVHTKFPPVVLPDADDDGVTDQFDVEPNTPAGAPVDVRGKARDTDSDGVPDFRDKELITPTTCQPVDADGVGTCPPPPCCAALDSLIKAGGVRGACGIGDLPSVRFTGNGKTLSRDAQAILTSVAQKMKDNPNCVITIVGYGEADKRAQQMSWDRANAVRTFLIEKQGISADRLIFEYGQSGSSDTVDLQDKGTSDGSPNTVPPRPEYRR